LVTPRFHLLDQPYFERLAAAGAMPEDVDVDVCTRLHVDHCGWNTKRVGNRWVSSFPEARRIFSAVECTLADTRSKPLPSGDVTVGGFEGRVLPILEAGLAELPDGICEIEPEVTVEPAPGHTTGHVVWRVRSRGSEALFTRDVMHQPIQIVRPDWNSRCFEKPQILRVTRRRFSKTRPTAT
jgi:glyoxylase-like metal-dependent hydrolase (beta-lactamase superfamily II)